jgi:hypothetical protein|tara:strand:- start:250 stop:399 length:150 start_codon:yes stop_codon:yes gene_type:complete
LEDTRKYKVTPIPEVTKTFKTEDYDFLIIADRAVWEVHTNKECIEIADK